MMVNWALAALIWYNVFMTEYGPYIRKDGRKHMVIRLNGKNTTISYPRFLMQNAIGRPLDKDETVDHINGDFTDDRLENLQILSRSDNAKKYLDDFPNRKAKYLELTCSNPKCGKLFLRDERVSRRALNINVHKGYCFCSRHCSGIVFH